MATINDFAGANQIVKSIYNSKGTFNSLEERLDSMPTNTTISDSKGSANGLASLDDDGRLVQEINASSIIGVIGIEHIPPAAIEKLTKVADEAARFALTIDDVQNGDTVKEIDTEMLYLVIDDTKLDVADGYEIYTAGSAASVPFGGVTGKPTTISGYGITNALSTSDITGSATQGLRKITTSTSAPSGGSDGDIWIQYIA